jgi:1,2-diacylglycerol 3-beta-glucosyltransferase
MIWLLVHLLALTFLIPALLIACYHLLLALVTLFSRKGTSRKAPPKHRFAIVVPAHDEEALIAKTVESCRKSAYPLDMFKIFVVADNCSDNTKEKAQSAGATVLIRFDEMRKGKGFALEWAFEQLAPEAFDTYVILDADCVLDPRALAVFNDHLADGAEVLQASYGVANSDASATSHILAIGNQIESRLFYFPKSKLGLPTFLRGTGMVFTKSVLQRVPWRASSIVEDSEYSIALIRNGIPIVSLWETLVWTIFPVNLEQLAIQRKRWAEGNLSLGKKMGVRLIFEGIRKRDLALTDAGWSLLVLSRPLILAELMLAIATCAAAAVWMPSYFSTLLLTKAVAAAAIQFGYFLAPVFMQGLAPCRILLLLRAPLVMAALMVISIKGLMGTPHSSWDRTPRSQ